MTDGYLLSFVFMSVGKIDDFAFLSFAKLNKELLLAPTKIKFAFASVSMDTLLYLGADWVIRVIFLPKYFHSAYKLIPIVTN